ncbi:hypothetical protein CIT292_07031 [Citrobacter youngae ATCC 29220]|uniref:Uncharacterized protein n=1 Tax=Citrobacter youngae ATCC 29220 TaxID=500640 RepID=D4B991_9ENTR|nr:hypothetical protein CIT292_07031 [Citrobacter youngae ATCC 29220]
MTGGSEVLQIYRKKYLDYLISQIERLDKYVRLYVIEVIRRRKHIVGGGKFGQKAYQMEIPLPYKRTECPSTRE